MIEYVTKHNLAEVLPLIADYQNFYQAGEICQRKNSVFFARFSAHSPIGCQFAYRHQQQVIGFATVLFSYSSILAAKVALLNDLYIVPEQRNQGYARQLIKHCHLFAQAKKAARLQWLTKQDNHRAQGLYDTLPATKSPWFVYTLNNQLSVKTMR
ncbi:GNAT family N-acetyltransferase [Paraglaciecola hydrolytica]|uniref:Acetyltransferase n=1 Tax=Paraglaciecola hydrolytica TaxID=1799789 RepID=A0A148KMH2_9ALTE|nr:GNAT family N-acetyltransferase [Paraglaciecola hydrolytica]KXI27445.1 acetyltransferase [Paraglaciecola hydrolytica]